MATGTQTAPLPGQLFDVPGIPGGSTQWFNQYEDTYDLAATLPSTASKPLLGIQKFRQTDVVLNWQLEATIVQDATAGDTPLTASDYAPWNYLGTVSVLIQNQYSAITVESGIDLYIASLMRNYMRTYDRSLMGANPAGFPAGETAFGYPAAANAQANLDWPRQYTDANHTYTLVFTLGPGCWFDSYYDLAIAGTPTSAPHSAFVSPQYMAGTTRVITPQVKLNQVISTTTTDIAPLHGATATQSGTGTFSFRRIGVYAGNPAVNPVVYAWQHRTKTDRYNTIAGASRATIEIPLTTGQIMGTWLRFFDPSATSTAGAPIPITDLTNIQFQYGSGLLRFYGTPAEIQRLWIQQHGNLLPPGVIALDFARNERGQVTNHRLPNTLTTGGILWFLQWKSARSAKAYAVLGCESLVYVT